MKSGEQDKTKGEAMKVELSEKQVGLVSFAIQILLDDETTTASDRRSLRAIQEQLKSNQL